MYTARWILSTLAVLGSVAAIYPPMHAQPQDVPDSLPFVIQQDSSFIPVSAQPSLGDLLVRSKARLFYDYARDSAAVSSLLVDPNGAATLLAPTDSAILALARKPHEGPESRSSSEVSSNEEERQRAEWLERWVKAHVVLEQVELEEGEWEEREYTTMDGKTVRFAPRGDDGEGRQLLPGEIEVVGEAQGSNGKVLYLQGTLTVD
ncbi:hypothetical protein JCM6882_006588 [Rhodosporidiobolus microsporus]